MDVQGNGLLIVQEKLHLAMDVRPENFSFDKFRYMCILSGCDYLPSLPGIGLVKARRFINRTADPDIHRVILSEIVQISISTSSLLYSSYSHSYLGYFKNAWSFKHAPTCGFKRIQG